MSDEAAGAAPVPRAVGVLVLGAFLLGSCAAAAGIHLEGEGYGGLAVWGGALVFAVSACPAWLLLRRPGPPRP